MIVLGQAHDGQVGRSQVGVGGRGRSSPPQDVNAWFVFWRVLVLRDEAARPGSLVRQLGTRELPIGEPPKRCRTAACLRASSSTVVVAGERAVAALSLISSTVDQFRCNVMSHRRRRTGTAKPPASQGNTTQSTCASPSLALRPVRSASPRLPDGRRTRACRAQSSFTRPRIAPEAAHEKRTKTCA